MGRKSRKGSFNKNEDDADMDGSNVPEKDTNTKGGKKQNNHKHEDLDFAQRRELQRQQAAEKRRSKMKCYLCGRSGHVRRDCPGIADDGRGMSRYKGKSDPKGEKQKYRAQKYGEGVVEKPLIAKVEYPSEFMLLKQGDGDGDDGEVEDPFVFYDAGCNVAATMDYMRSGRGKHKLSQREAVEEYRCALEYASTEVGLGGLVSRTDLYKPNMTWKEPPLPEDLPVPIFYILGLTSNFKCSTDELRNQTTSQLLETLRLHSSKIIGFGGQLDYTTKGLAKVNGAREEQLERLRCTFEAAGQARVPIQIKTSPGAASLNPEEGSVAGTDYAKMLLDLQTVISDSLSNYPDLKIHLSCWSGRADHMIAILNAFSNVVIGLDGSVSFTKAKHLHECSFEVPLDRFLLETSTIIPAGVANCLGREAAFHSGWWPHVADTVAHHKKIPVMDVARAATETTLRVYPQLLSGASNR